MAIIPISNKKRGMKFASIPLFQKLGSSELELNSAVNQRFQMTGMRQDLHRVPKLTELRLL